MVTTTNRTVLHVTGFSPYLRARDLAYEFERYGRLVRCDIPALKSSQATPFAFIEFRREDDAEDAYYDMHGRAIDGRRIAVQWAKRPPSALWRHDGGVPGERAPRDNRGRADDQRGRRPDDGRRNPPRHRSPSPARSYARDRSPSRRPDRDASPPRRLYAREASPPRRDYDERRRSHSPKRDDRDGGDDRRADRFGDDDRYEAERNGESDRNGSGRDE